MTRFCPKCNTETGERVKHIRKRRTGIVVDVKCVECGYYHGRFWEHRMVPLRDRESRSAELPAIYALLEALGHGQAAFALETHITVKQEVSKNE